MTTVEEIVTANLILPIIKDLVLPKIEALNKIPNKPNIDLNNIQDNISSYLTQRYEKFLVIDTLAFPNKQTLFKILYEPLTIKTRDGLNKSVQFKIDCYPKKFLPEYIRVIIEDTAGMGKSTITRKLFLSAIEEKAGIPILIELRQINKRNNFIKEIQNQLNQIGKPIQSEIIYKLLSQGEFIFLLDGFDEISKVNKEFVINELHKFVEKANNNLFLITSRPEDSLVSFGDFQKFSIKPLVNTEAYTLIEKYDTYSFKPISNDLIDQLKKNDKSLDGFLSNPFLVTLLYKTFDFKKDIPLKKSQFYRQVYDALFEAHDLSKEGYLKRDKHTNLHLDDFERILRYIAFFSSIENRIEYDKDNIIKLIKKVQTYNTDLLFNPSDYLLDLLETVPLFKRDGHFIKWAHKSLQDYFAAKFIWIDAKEDQNKILKKIYSDSENNRFYNVIDLFYELDPALFDKTLLFWLLQDFHDFVVENLAAFPDIDENLVKIRLENTFNKKNEIAVTLKSEFDIIQKGLNGEEDIIEKYFNLVDLDSFSTNYTYFEEPRLVVFNFVDTISNRDTILKILSYRMPNLVTYKTHIIELGKLDYLTEGESYKVNFDSDNPINNDKIFKTINEILATDYILNYDIALKKFQEIKTLLDKRHDDNEFLNW